MFRCEIGFEAPRGLFCDQKVHRATVLSSNYRKLPNGPWKGACWCVIVLNCCMFACRNSERVCSWVLQGRRCARSGSRRCSICIAWKCSRSTWWYLLQSHSTSRHCLNVTSVCTGVSSSWTGACLRVIIVNQCVCVFLFFFLITLQPRAKWYTSLWALNSSPPRNRFTFLWSSCS